MSETMWFSVTKINIISMVLMLDNTNDDEWITLQEAYENIGCVPFITMAKQINVSPWNYRKQYQ